MKNRFCVHLSLKMILFAITVLTVTSCSQQKKSSVEISAADILGNPDYPAFSYGGYREDTRDIVPTVEELKQDMRILSAMGVKIIRTYNTNQYPQASNLLQAIHELKQEDPAFEMYVMLGAWIDCKGAWTDSPDHTAGNTENNSAEIEAAVDMVKTYPDIVKIIAVGNEAMVRWAVNYYVEPNVILKWVRYLQDLKKSGEIPANTWITSSDNYESWGGGDKSYQTDDLAALIEAVDYVSMHTYPFHDSHYNPAFWGVPPEEENLSDIEKIHAAMLRAKEYAKSQYQGVADYIAELGLDRPIHIGETGWATVSGSLYGATGSRAADEYKEKLYYDHMRDWTDAEGMSCFYFEIFDERWKDQVDPAGSENHFGLINLEGQVKYALWELFDKGVFNGLSRNGVPITKTYDGDFDKLMDDILPPKTIREIGLRETITVNENRDPGEPVTESTYLVIHESMKVDQANDIAYPSSPLILNAWEGTCGVEMSFDGTIKIVTGIGEWWGCGLEMGAEGSGEDLTNFRNGSLNFEIKGSTECTFDFGFQTGKFVRGDQTNNFITFGPEQKHELTEAWASHSIPISNLNDGANLADVTAVIFLRGVKDLDGKHIYVKNVYYSTK